MHGSFTFHYIQFLRFEGSSQQSINISVDSLHTYVTALYETTADYRRRMWKGGRGAELHISFVCAVVEDKHPASGLRQYTLIKVF